MLKLRNGLFELIRKVATSLPADVEEALKGALGREDEGSNARRSLQYIVENIRIARGAARPVCQDTGVPVFYVRVPRGLGHGAIKETILEAVRIATELIPLRPNAVDVLTERNSGDNTGIGVPILYMEETEGGPLTVDLMLKGSGCENAGQTYKLPVEEIGAERDLEGVRRCVLDAVYRVQGRACPPYTIGVGIGAAKDQVARLSKEQLLRKLPEASPFEAIALLEKTLLQDINMLGIGPLGMGGKTTAIGVKIGHNHRHPASYFVDVSFSCWALRRGRLLW